MKKSKEIRKLKKEIEDLKKPILEKEKRKQKRILKARRACRYHSTGKCINNKNRNGTVVKKMYKRCKFVGASASRSCEYYTVYYG